MDVKLNIQLNDALAQHDYESALKFCAGLYEAGDRSAKLEAVKGWCLYQRGDIKEAESLLVAAFNRDSTDHFVASMTITFYMECGEYTQVVRLAQYCVGQHPRDRLIWHRLGTAQFLLGDLIGSEIAFRRSLLVEETDSTAFALSQPLLCQGNYEEGLELYEFRFGAHKKINWPQSELMPMPKWNGEPLQGKSILVWTEQGLGDCIQFARLISVLAQHGAIVDIMMPASHAGLASLIASIEGVANVFVIHSREISLHRRYDYQSPLMSLMRGLKIRPSTIPSKGCAYLSAPPAKPEAHVQPQIDEIRSRSGDLKIGLVWTTALRSDLKEKDTLNYLQKERKSLSNDDVLPVLRIGAGYKLYSLHVEKSPSLDTVLKNEEITDLSPYINDFTDTANFIEALDIIISVDSSVAHLAGALNKPVINLLPFAADWRWQSNREDSPWYPSMRLLRQSFPGDWSTVVGRLENILPKIRTRFEELGELEIWL